MAEYLTSGCTVKICEKGDSFLVLLLLDASSLLARPAAYPVNVFIDKYLFSVELLQLKDTSQPRLCICLYTGKIVDSTLNA